MKRDKRNFGQYSYPIAKAMLHEIYLCGELLAPEFYIEDFNLIRNAANTDTIKIRLNTGGGRMDTALQFLRAMGESEAHIITSIEGYCVSAGTLIFLAGHEFEISENSIIMIHNYSGGLLGKGHEMYAQSTFELLWSTELFKSSYEEFLTPAEIQSVLGGSDLYFTSSQAGERCEKLLAYRQDLAELYAEEEELKSQD